METLRRAIYRASAEPTVPLPMGARSVGHYRVGLDHSEKALRKSFVQLFWGIAGTGEMIHRGRGYSLGPGGVFLYMPGDEHRLRTAAEPWEYRWLTLDGEMPARVARSFGLGRAVRRSGACPEDLFLQLEGRVAEVTPQGERRACATAFRILAAACGTEPGPSTSDLAVAECAAAIERRFADPDFTIASLARDLRIHRSSLSRLFSNRMGVSPQQYLMSTRMQKAMSMLRETEMRVSEVAYASGYTDPNYFARAMRNRVGLSPQEFRRQ